MFNSQVATDPSYEFTSVSIDSLARNNADTFRCPRDLTSNFIDGTLGDLTFTETFLRISACAADNSDVTCMAKADRDDKIKSLKVQFIYLETNFEGKNI